MAINWLSVLISSGVGIASGAIWAAILSKIFGKAAMTIPIDEKKLMEKAKGFLAKLGFDALKMVKDKIMGKEKKCPFCRKTIPGAAAFCLYCGKPISGSKSCPDCQITLPDNAKVCYLCGSSDLQSVKT